MDIILNKKKEYIRKTFEFENMFFTDKQLQNIITKNRKGQQKMKVTKYEKWEDYFIDDTGVLKNIPNIKDKLQLSEYEKQMSAERLSELYDEPTLGELNQEHLISIHHYLFQDVYDWAGEYRKVPMMKQTVFLDHNEIDTYLNNLFNEANDNINNIQNEYEFADFLSNLFYKLTYAHPFREGNGRTIREFIRQLVNSLNFEFGSYEIDYSKMNTQTLAFGLCCNVPMFITSEFKKSLITKEKQKIKTL